MRALKITGVIVMGLWMAWITWSIEVVRTTAETACDFAFSAAARSGDPSGKLPMRPCPPFVPAAQNSN